jgi:putative spermidine/putrescine transport system permease protein
LTEAARAKVSPVAWLAAPAALFFVLFFLLPFAVMALFSALTGNPMQRPNVTFTARHYARILDDSLYVESLASTLKIGAVTTAAALLLGYPLAHWLARMRSRGGHALLLMAVIAPMLTGIVVRTFAWITILSDKGVINATLMAAGVIATPLPLMYNELGTVIALVHIYVPFMVLTLAAISVALMTPLSDRIVIQAKVRTTMPVSIGAITAMRRSAWPPRERIRASQCASG